MLEAETNQHMFATLSGVEEKWTDLEAGVKRGSRLDELKVAIFLAGVYVDFIVHRYGGQVFVPRRGRSARLGAFSTAHVRQGFPSERH